MRRLIFMLTAAFLAVILMGVSRPAGSSIGIDSCVSKFKLDSKEFSNSTFLLRDAIEAIDSVDFQTVIKAREALRECRIRFKALEFFLEYFFSTAAVTYNMPPVVEVEEPNIEYREPVGLQVIESLLYEKDIMPLKADLLMQMEVIISSAEDINSLLFNFKGTDQQLLESVRLELIRIMTLGVSGFDAPLLKSGIRESWAALSAVKHALSPFLKERTGEADSVILYLEGSLNFLHANADFDSFDRLVYLTDFALPLQYYLGMLIEKLDLDMNSVPTLNYKRTHLFSPDFLVKNAFSASLTSSDSNIINLGRALFSEPALSGNHSKSCATCHSPGQYFTDGLSRSKAFDESTSLKRNAPSILYSAFQYFQRWDGTANSIEDQILSVLYSPEEMNATEEIVLRHLRDKNGYEQKFKQAFADHGDCSVSIDNIVHALAGFVRNGNPFNSAFDQYMQGRRDALTDKQKKGFNLFMGKAQCGTCHFAPLFGGVLPPLYNFSEIEVIGVPKTEQMDKPEYDGDKGRYELYPIRYYDRAFKTPGLRNIAKTAPYMHNGAFTSLQNVMTFYNKGGGNGIGLDQDNQTLAPDSLNLSEEESEDIISFLNALTDSLPPSLYGHP